MGHHGCVISISIIGTADGDSDEEPVFSVTMQAVARSDETDSSDEGAADLTILKPSFLPQKTLDYKESIYRTEI